MCFIFLFSIYKNVFCFFFFFQAEDGIRDLTVTGVQTCALPIWPRASETGEMVRETVIVLPSFVSREMSNASTHSPFRIRSSIRGTSSAREGGARMELGRPITSSAVYPYREVAATFQLRIVPSSVLPMMASCDDSTIDARRDLSVSARRFSATAAASTMAVTVVTTMNPCKSSRDSLGVAKAK